MKIRKDQILTVAIIAVILVTFALVVFLPQRKRLGKLRDERNETAGALEREKAKAVELAQLRGDVKRMEGRLRFFDERLPDQQELGQFLRDVSNYADISGLQGATFQPKEVREGELYLEMPIEMKFAGTFAELYTFLRRAKRMTRLTHVRGLSVQNDRVFKGECDIDLVMTIYFTR